jgi:hypothetical protein
MKEFLWSDSSVVQGGQMLSCLVQGSTSASPWRPGRHGPAAARPRAQSPLAVASALGWSEALGIVAGAGRCSDEGVLQSLDSLRAG